MTNQNDDRDKGKGSVLSNPAVQPDSQKMFEIEISNPFFTGPSSIQLADLTAPKTQAIAKQATNNAAKDPKNASS